MLWIGIGKDLRLSSPIGTSANSTIAGFEDIRGHSTNEVGLPLGTCLGKLYTISYVQDCSKRRQRLICTFAYLVNALFVAGLVICRHLTFVDHVFRLIISSFIFDYDA
jgi:hypothetical protein